MPQPIDTNHTTKNLSLEELVEYCKRLDRHLQNRKVDEGLLQRAWYTAHKIAAMLYDDFGATQVAVFGSLVEQDGFSITSDIDIVVWGLSQDSYIDALWETRNFTTEFKIDLVNFHSAKGRFRERIQCQAVHIENTGTAFDESTVNTQAFLTIRKENYEVNRRIRIERIVDECVKIEHVNVAIGEILQDIEEVPIKYRKGQEALLTQNVVNFYMGLENIFKRIAEEIDMMMPQGKDWHKDLLHQMAAKHSIRPPVISNKTVKTLIQLLKFRHLARNIYGFELELEGIVENAQRVCDIYEILSTELKVFIKWLEKQTDEEN